MLLTVGVEGWFRINGSHSICTNNTKTIGQQQLNLQLWKPSTKWHCMDPWNHWIIKQGHSQKVSPQSQPKQELQISSCMTVMRTNMNSLSVQVIQAHYIYSSANHTRTVSASPSTITDQQPRYEGAFPWNNISETAHHQPLRTITNQENKN